MRVKRLGAKKQLVGRTSLRFLLRARCSYRLLLRQAEDRRAERSKGDALARAD